MSSVTAQLISDHYLVNLCPRGRVLDLAWENFSQTNFLSRGWIELPIFIDGTKIPDDLNWDQNYPQGQKLIAITYSTQFNSILVDQTYSLTNQGLSIKFKLRNQANDSKQIELFAICVPDILENAARDCALYLPNRKSIIFYERDQYLELKGDHPLSGYACQGPLDFNGRGAHPDKDRNLSGNPVATGKVQGALKYSLKLGPNTSKAITINLNLAHSEAGLPELQKFSKISQPEKSDTKFTAEIEAETATIAKATDLADLLELSEDETAKLKLVARVSSNIVSKSFGNLGANFAALDSTYFTENNGVEDYAYFWPRDGALVFQAGTRAGVLDPDKQQKYFEFIAKCLDPGGFLLHKYNITDPPTPASTWHPRLTKAGQPANPFQFDETALNLIVYHNYIESGGAEVSNFADAIPAMSAYLESKLTETGAHKHCYDLWENHYGTIVSTQVAIAAALRLAGNSTTSQLASGYFQTELLPKLLDRPFRGFIETDSGQFEPHYTADAALHWIWQYGPDLLSSDELDQIVNSLAEKLEVNDSGGFARYEGDHYLNPDPHFYPGNVWFICTLWFAQYFLRTNQLERAAKSVRYVLNHMDRTGLIAEMADPNTGFGISVKPLVWSHAEVLNLLHWKKLTA